METDLFEVSATHRPHIVALDSVRGIAALSIVILHFGMTTPIVYLYMGNAYLVVDLFFVLSGFAIYYAYHDRLKTLAQIRRFVWLRFWRLYPIHFAMLLYFVCVELIKPVAGLFLPVHYAAFSRGGWGTIAANVLLLQSFNLTPSLSFNTPSWSISSEFYVYIFFACVAFSLTRKARVLGASLFICLAAVAVLAIFDPSMRRDFNNGWVRGVAGFFAGVLTCGVYLKARCRAAGLDFGLLALFSLVAVAAFIVFKPTGHYATLAIIPLSAVLILLVALSRPTGMVSLLTSGPFRWLGVISYSIYMVHAVVSYGLGYIVKLLMPGHLSLVIQLTLLAFNIAIVIALASGTFLWIEKPCRAWSRKTA